ncbi:MAG: threonylcarbamoyl-AMP synthase [Candidatus Dadabacteria bacterium]|nr:MAG: threonylcarbamoyl-AMP synthase [Candidatus Dadabacteria bacterium]
MYRPSSHNIKNAAHIIGLGEVVAFPTETVYGLGADAFNEQAVQKIFGLKGRPSYNPLIVHLAETDQIEEVAWFQRGSKVHETLKKLYRFWPGPLSVVLPRHPLVPDCVTGGLNTVAVRIPAHPVARDFLKACNTPIAAPSANKSSYISPTTAEHVYEEFGEKVAIIIDGGKCEVGLESTVISIVNDVPVILRPGYITREQLEDALGEVKQVSYTVPSRPESPGMLSKHYAPKTKVVLKKNIDPGNLPKKIGFISFGPAGSGEPDIPLTVRDNLSSSGDLEEVAENLYDALRKQDKMGLDLIVVDTCDKTGLGAAIMDRLTRACAD